VKEEVENENKEEEVSNFLSVPKDVTPDHNR